MITIYSKPQCPNCARSKELLHEKGISYVEINVEADDEAKAFLVAKGFRSVPQICVDGIFLDEGFKSLTKQNQTFFDTHKTN